jgi:2-polyprenyl-3-methyl-5-hydroxy-6-metoxy-1,4-benzoquinol methylase
MNKHSNPNSDAFGHAMYDSYLGQGVHEIIERDDGFIALSYLDLSRYFSPYSDWPEDSKRAIGYAKGRILDIGCGAGRVMRHLQEAGFSDVLGIDTSPLAVKVCRLQGLKKVKLLSIDDLTPAMGPFDTLVMFGMNFGLFQNFNQARRLLKRFYKMTSPSALIIATTMDPYQTTVKEHLDYHKRNRAKGRMGGQIRMRYRHKNLIGSWFEYLFVSKNEMKKILAGTGWTVREYIDTPGPIYTAIIAKEIPHAHS